MSVSVSTKMMQPATSARRSKSRCSFQWSLMRTPCTISDSPRLRRALSSGRVTAAEERRSEGPYGGARQNLQPVQRPIERMAGPAVDGKYDELVNHKLAHHDQGLLEHRFGADLLVLAHRDVGHQGQRQGVLAQ